jgi:hypothetical protein
MIWQWIGAVALVILAGAYLIRKSIRQRREGVVCDRCAAAAHVRAAKRPETRIAKEKKPQTG